LLFNIYNLVYNAFLNCSITQVNSDCDSDVVMVGKQQQQKRRAVFGDITNVSAFI